LLAYFSDLSSSPSNHRFAAHSSPNLGQAQFYCLLL
jgi:hypothetical protein